MSRDELDILWDEIAMAYFSEDGKIYRTPSIKKKGYKAGKVGVYSRDLDQLIRWCQGTRMGRVYRIPDKRRGEYLQMWRWEVGGRQDVWTFVTMMRKRVDTLCPGWDRGWSKKVLGEIEERLENIRPRRRSLSGYTGWTSPDVVYEPKNVPDPTPKVEMVERTENTDILASMIRCVFCGQFRPKGNALGTDWPPCPNQKCPSHEVEALTEKGGGDST